MIRVDVARCSGCRRCEVNCSFLHFQTVGRNVSRIKVVKIEGKGIDLPVVCQQCEERYCAECPEAAITVGRMGEIVVSHALCTACGVCETQCPIGAIELFDDIPLVCDLCGGDPRCVHECNLEAVVFESKLTESVSLRSMRRGGHRLPTEAKRVRYAERISQGIRDKWLSRMER